MVDQESFREKSGLNNNNEWLAGSNVWLQEQIILPAGLECEQ